METTWNINIEQFALHLAVGVHPRELEAQPVWATVRIRSTALARPATLQDCVDYEPLLQWMRSVWPHTPHTPLLETRINELTSFVFEMDGRVQAVFAGLYKRRLGVGALAVGIERETQRHEHEAARALAQCGEEIDG